MDEEVHLVDILNLQDSEYWLYFILKFIGFKFKGFKDLIKLDLENLW
jgi:hypothetical protein